MPSACAAMPIRPPSSVDMATLNPAPGGPSIESYSPAGRPLGFGSSRTLETISAHVGLWDAAALEDEVARARGADAELVLLLAEGEAGRARLDEGGGERSYDFSPHCRVTTLTRAGLLASTRKAESPLCLSDLSVVAITMAASASCALVIHACGGNQQRASPRSSEPEPPPRGRVSRPLCESRLCAL